MKRDQPEGEQTPIESKPKTVFILRDFDQKEIEETLDMARELPGLDVQVPGLDSQDDQGLVFRKFVREKIEGVDRVVAYVDLANANVAFEIGFSLGKGSRLAFARSRTELPTWFEVSPFAGSFASPAGDLPALEALLNSEKDVPAPERPARGDEILFLCPTQGNGKGYRQRVTERFGWRVLERDGWSFVDLGQLLSGVGTVVWVVTPLAETSDGRDHPETCSAAVVAGFADAVGIKVKIFRSRHHRELTDIADQRRIFESVGQLFAWLATIGSRSGNDEGSRDVLASYRDYLRSVHEDLVPFFSGVGDRVLSEVYVELEIERCVGDAPKLHGQEKPDTGAPRLHRRVSLRQLLDLEPSGNGVPEVTGRWVVLGEPGAGKSTACRHLCLELAQDSGGPIAIFVSLVRWREARRHPFEAAEEELRLAQGTPAAKGLARRLHQEAGETNRVWLLLDGLDEVKEGDRDETRRALEALLADLPNCRVVVTSRPAGHARLRSFLYAELQPLGPEAREELLYNWLPGKGPEVWQRLNRIPSLAELAKNPLMLTLIAKLSEVEESLPRTRIELYRKALDLLLRRGHGGVEQAVLSPISAEALLEPLALALHEGGGESWSERELDSTLDAVLAKDPNLERNLTRTWRSNEHFLEDVGFHSGVLAPAGGREEPWSYMHRSFREYLAALALSKHGEERYLEIASGLKGDAEKVSRWGETFALLCGLVEGPKAGPRLLNQVREAESELALRALPHVEGLSAEETLEFLWGTVGWDGDHLALLVAGCRSWGTTSDEVEALLMSRVTRKLSTETLAFLYYALEKAGVEVDREAFFRFCDRWPEGGPEVPGAVPIPPEKEGDSFLMGSPDGVGDDSERPQHHVTLTSYCMARTAVTEEQFTRFDRSRPSSGKRLPVVEVSWWEAWLYCRWVDGFLPTEAQWEFACRAGTLTRWWTGDEEKRLGRAAWYDENSDLELHPVANKAANPWGLYDVHGNVWEWCADWYGGSYGRQDQTDPAGPEGGSVRVIRGGCSWSVADGCRSAYRSMGLPDDRDVSVGFRVALPAAPSS